MKLGLLAGFLIASPFVFAQFWLFVAPGLYTREKQRRPAVRGLRDDAVRGGRVVLAPRRVSVDVPVLRVVRERARPVLPDDQGSRSGFYIKMVLAFGIVFQMPILVFFLARFGIVTWKFMAKQFKYAVLIIFIIAAVVTPSGDPVNQTIFAAPMIVLYVLSIGVAWLFGKKRPKETET